VETEIQVVLLTVVAVAEVPAKDDQVITDQTQLMEEVGQELHLKYQVRQWHMQAVVVMEL
jgi:hypothetical protein